MIHCERSRNCVVNNVYTMDWTCFNMSNFVLVKQNIIKPFWNSYVDEN